ncbi:hypothetical protein NI17_005090 [Thermobifida halotolerans]|uniref:Uncharacterized protein n=1 Tax=Thermobifida halotolerans TaxID=483545 RepID=A0A399G6X8_9ACTN|nr:hypothetical protein [Thermobifida halotolerans]UOE20595.1 hypothetical protein NI17_005090 [Thermobifida halotolerans]
MEHRLDGFAVARTRAVIAELAATGGDGSGHGPPPPAPPPHVLGDHGIPTVDRAEFERVFGDPARRRSALAALVRHRGWSGEDVRPS